MQKIITVVIVNIIGLTQSQIERIGLSLISKEKSHN